MSESEWIRLALVAWGATCLGLLLGALLTAEGPMTDEERAQDIADRIVEQGREDARRGRYGYTFSGPPETDRPATPPPGQGHPWADEGSHGRVG